MTERFQVGTSERHVVTVKKDLLMKYITIEVDDQQIVHDWHPSPFAKKFHFDVGTSETHKVEVSTGMLSSTKALVDGKPVQLTA